VIGAYVLQALRNHAEILDRIKYTERGIVTEDLIASLFGVRRSWSPTPLRRSLLSSRTRHDEANATYSFIGGGKSALLCLHPKARR
jgi:hypothetical protein